MGANWDPFFADLILYGYEAEFIQELLEAGKKHLAQRVNFNYRYIYDVLYLDNLKTSESELFRYVPVGEIEFLSKVFLICF